MNQVLGQGNPPPAASPTPRSGVVTLSIRTKFDLYQAWMPFLAGGGFFIPTNRPYVIGEEVFVLLTILSEPEKITLRGSVAWINPANMSDGRPQGIGLSLQGDPAAAELRKRVEGILAGAASSTRPTHTI